MAMALMIMITTCKMVRYRNSLQGLARLKVLYYLLLVNGIDMFRWEKKEEGIHS